MDMTLSDIEAKADELVQRLLVAGKSEALLIGIQIGGLRDLAQIKAVGDQRAQWNASVGMREEDSTRRDREIAAMEAVAAKVPEPTTPERRCEIQREAIVLGEKPERKTRLQCLLADGHPGLHTDCEGVKWDEEVRFVQPPASGVPPCPSTFQRSKDEYYVCTLEYQHEGQHRGGGMWWSGPGNGGDKAEPTKPAADRLHELLSYVTDQQVQATALIDNDVRPTVRDQAAARRHAYHDVALKLEDILSEGGI